MLGPQRDESGRWELYNGSEDDLAEEVAALKQQGWRLVSEVSNTAYRNDT